MWGRWEFRCKNSNPDPRLASGRVLSSHALNLPITGGPDSSRYTTSPQIAIKGEYFIKVSSKFKV